jgi:hypothetical protein
MADRYSREDFLGPAFCLSLELGFAGNDAHATAALTALWSCPLVEGPWAEPGDIGRIASRGGPATSPFGLFTSGPVGHSLPFSLSLIREERAQPPAPPDDPQEVRIEFGVQTRQPSDWATLDIPVRALAAIWPVDITWSVAGQPWLLPLCRALADVADHVHTHAPILGGVMGEETSGCWRVPTRMRVSEAEQGYPPLAVLSAEVVEERGGFLVTPDLWRRLAPRVDAVALPSGLLYTPPGPTARLTGA